MWPIIYAPLGMTHTSLVAEYQCIPVMWMDVILSEGAWGTTLHKGKGIQVVLFLVLP